MNPWETNTVLQRRLKLVGEIKSKKLKVIELSRYNDIVRPGLREVGMSTDRTGDYTGILGSIQHSAEQWSSEVQIRTLVRKGHIRL